MFMLNTHKEIMAYKLYTERNLSKKLIDPLIFQLQYYKENKDRLSIKDFHKDCLQLMKNINLHIIMVMMDMYMDIILDIHLYNISLLYYLYLYFHNIYMYYYKYYQIKV